MANISKNKAIEKIYLALEDGIRHNDAKKRFVAEMGLSPNTWGVYWKEAKLKYQERLKKTELTIQSKEDNRVVNILETKDGQVDALIERCNTISEELKSGTTIEWNWNFGEYDSVIRKLSANELRDRHVLFMKYLAEIRIIRGLNHIPELSENSESIIFQQKNVIINIDFTNAV